MIIYISSFSNIYLHKERSTSRMRLITYTFQSIYRIQFPRKWWTSRLHVWWYQHKQFKICRRHCVNRGVRGRITEIGLKMNVKKTKTMIVRRVSKDTPKPNANIKLNGQNWEQVDKFKYLGQWITADGRCDVEVKSRIEIARKTFLKLKDVLTTRRINLKLRKRLVQCYVGEVWDLSDKIHLILFYA